VSVHPRQVQPSLLQLDAVLRRLSGASALAEVCRFLREEFPHYAWVGVYRREGGSLRLVAWDGDRPTEHTEIPVDRGLCGKAVRENRTVIVGDVRREPDYLACFLETRSEIVVPIRDGGEPVGEIDIDGTAADAYDLSDDRFLTSVAERLVPALRAVPPGAEGGPRTAA
jgi:L-methionine (R)-S-oxide reductase